MLERSIHNTIGNRIGSDDDQGISWLQRVGDDADGRMKIRFPAWIVS